MRRYWIEKTKINDQTVLIDGDSFHHICEVCRMEIGSKFEVIVEGGKAYFVELTAVEKRRAFATVRDERAIQPLPKPFLHLAVSIPKFQRMDEIVEKAVEMGVKTLVPFVSDYSFVRKLGDPLESKVERWKRIVMAATQQCGRGELMEISEPIKLENLLQHVNQSEGSIGLFPYEGDATTTAKQALGKIHQAQATDIWAFVGSEGGFSDREVDLFTKAEIMPFTLGQQVLRVETACTAVISILKYELDLMR